MRYNIDVYARLLVRVEPRRGYPLWFPEPDNNLPEEYRRDGLRIGDVGVVTEFGGFDVFFNICLPETHPLHHRGVPENFKQVVLDHRDVSNYPSADAAGRVISTRTIRQKSLTAAVSGGADTVVPANATLAYEFCSSSTEGALLVLPDGADRHDLLNKSLFMEVAKENAISWYRFAISRLGRTMISNDSLYLITGCHKASSWSLASFYNHGVGAEFVAQFTAGQVVNGNIAGAYSWQTTNSVPWRVGPATEYSGEKNQAVFIAGFKIAIRQSILRRHRIEVATGLPRTNSDAKHFQQDRRFLGESSGSSSQGSTSVMNRRITSPQRSPQESIADSAIGTVDGNQHERWSPMPQDELQKVLWGETPMDIDRSDNGSDSDVSTRGVVSFASKIYHPSDLINLSLLERMPSADVAITHDSQWWAVFSEINGELPYDDSEIIGRVHVKFAMVCDKSTAHLQVQPQVARLPQNHDTSLRHFSPNPFISMNFSMTPSSLGEASFINFHHLPPVGNSTTVENPFAAPLLSPSARYCQWAERSQASPCNFLLTGDRRELMNHLRVDHHLRVHGRVKVQCLWANCDTLLQRENLARHITSCHFRKKVRCPKCGRGFCRPDVQQAHVGKCCATPQDVSSKSADSVMFSHSRTLERNNIVTTSPPYDKTSLQVKHGEGGFRSSLYHPSGSYLPASLSPPSMKVFPCNLLHGN